MNTARPVTTIDLGNPLGKDGSQFATLNTQPPEKRRDVHDGTLDVHSIFHTIQGEGPFAGEPAVFVRLAGCVLQCPSCDTEYTRGREQLTITEVIERVEVLEGPNTSLVVVTGGEPFRQALGDFITRLLHMHYAVQVETNGTLYDTSLAMMDRHYLKNLSIVCSPKMKVNPELKPYITHLKYVMRAGEVAEDGLPTRVLGLDTVPERPWEGFTGRVYLQPVDESTPDAFVRNKANLKACVDSCMKHGYILSLQLHKLIGLP